MALIFNALRVLRVFDRGLHRICGVGLSGSPALLLLTGMGGEGVRAAGWLVPYNTFGRGKFIHIAHGPICALQLRPVMGANEVKKRKRGGLSVRPLSLGKLLIFRLSGRAAGGLGY
jgi:hypothetical protein